MVVSLVGTATLMMRGRVRLLLSPTLLMWWGVDIPHLNFSGDIRHTTAVGLVIFVFLHPLVLSAVLFCLLPLLLGGVTLR